MKVAVATDDGTSVASHFGRCAGFLVFECDNGRTEKLGYRRNGFGHHHQDESDHHEHGHDHAEKHHSHADCIKTLADCQAVICRGMGRRAISDLVAGGIQPAITTEDISAQEASDRYAQGRLCASSDSTCCSH